MRTFSRPHSAVAILEDGDTSIVNDETIVIVFHSGASAEAARDPGASGGEFTIRGSGFDVTYRPGHADVACSAELDDDVIVALAQFAFLDGELRRLERDLAAISNDADADVSRAFRITKRDRKHWPRFQKVIEQLTRLRLKFVYLQSAFSANEPTLSPIAQRIFKRLLRAANMEKRLEHFDERLEIFEELYEGAVDRVADFRWYSGGHLLEAWIIALLVVEVIALFGDLLLRYFEVL